MPVIVKGSSVAATNSANLLLPANIVAGDLIVLVLTSYNTLPSPPSGYTSKYSFNRTVGSYSVFVNIVFKIAAGNESSTSLTISPLENPYTGLYSMVVSGHDPVNPLTGYNYNYGSTSATTNAVSVSKLPATMFTVVASMANNTTASTFTTPSGTTLMQSLITTNYYSSALYQKTEQHTAGIAASMTVTGTQPGTHVAAQFAISDGYAPPVTSNLQPNNVAMGAVRDANGTVNFTWSTANPDNYTYVSSELQYRYKNTNNSWTGYTSTTPGLVSIDHADPEDGEEFEVRARNIYSETPAEWAYAEFTGGNHVWTYLNETTSLNGSNGTPVSVSTVSGGVPLEGGLYQVQVKTADSSGYGPWSASAIFEINSAPNKPTNITLNPPRVGGNIQVSWTYLDKENNPQTQYQIQYRRKP